MNRHVLLTLALICLIPCCWLLIKMREARSQREAVAVIRNRGGSVGYEEPRGPEWLSRLLGIDFVANATNVSFGQRATDTDMACLIGLPYCQELHLDHAEITDAGLEYLKGLSRLHGLSLDGTSTTDSGLKSLTQLRQLYWLRLDGTRITDSGLPCLAGLDRLSCLYLRGTRVTDKGLQQLVRLPLDSLDVADTQISNAGLTQIQSAKPRLLIGSFDQPIRAGRVPNETELTP